MRADQIEGSSLAPDGGDDPWHPIPIGASVVVLRVAGSLPPYVEGRATVLAPAHGPHRYQVSFLGGPIPKIRTVHPDYQNEPEKMLALLVDLWCADAAIFDDFEDFLPMK